MSGVRLQVNGADRDVVAGTTVSALVDEVAGDQRRVAVAVNGDVVERGRWDAVELGAGDRVEIVAAIQGGARGDHRRHRHGARRHQRGISDRQEQPWTTR